MVEGMPVLDVRSLRKLLGLSRAEFSRFLGVSEATIVRWESRDAVTEPKGLQAVLLKAISDAALNRPPRDVARLVRSCGFDHRNALQQLLAAAG
jgi:transcriptional regulator with XRE-family HTH domain